MSFQIQAQENLYLALYVLSHNLMRLSLHSSCSYYTFQQFISTSYNWELRFDPLEYCSFLHLSRQSIVDGP